MKSDSKMRILLADNCGVSSSELAKLLPLFHLPVELAPVRREQLSGASADGMILSAEDFALAEALGRQDFVAVLLLADAAKLETLYPACIASGFLAGDRARIRESLPQLLALCCRLRAVRMRENSLQRKLDDTRLVNRAKLLLMSRLQMTEAQAHRFIEKTAMDSGMSKRDVAVGIIRTYEE